MRALYFFLFKKGMKKEKKGVALFLVVQIDILFRRTENFNSPPLFSGKRTEIFIFSKCIYPLPSAKSQGKHTGEEGLFYVNNFMSFVGKSVYTTVCFALEKASNPFRDLWLTLIARLRGNDSACQKIPKLLLWVNRARKQRFY